MKIYAEYVCKVYEDIKKSGLEDCLGLIDDSKKVFITMSFVDKIKGARENIQKVEKDSGYMPILIDVKEHINLIALEI